MASVPQSGQAGGIQLGVSALQTTIGYTPPPSIGDVSLDFTPSGTGAIVGTVQDKLQQTVNLLDFIPVTQRAAILAGTSTYDATAAIIAADASLPVGGVLNLPAGRICFATPLVFSRQRTAWTGPGAHQCELRYTGAATNVDLLTFGNNSAQLVGVRTAGFRVTSATVMTAGYAVRFRLMVRSLVDDVYAEGQGGSANLWNGIFFDRVDRVSYLSFDIKAQNVGLSVCGAVGSGPKADLWLGGGFKIGQCALGILVGGAFGGLYTDAGDVINNGTNLLIDNSLAAEENREIFLGGGCFFDTSTGDSVVLNQTINTTGAAWLLANQCWISTSGGHGLRVIQWGGQIQVFGGTYFNHAGDGIRLEDTTTNVQIIGPFCRSNGGYGVNAPASSSNFYVTGVRGTANTSGTANNTNLLGTTTFNRGQFNYLSFDSTAYAQIQGADLVWNWDASDYITYVRASNLYRFVVAQTDAIRATGVASFDTGLGITGQAGAVDLSAYSGSATVADLRLNGLGSTGAVRLFANGALVGRFDNSLSGNTQFLARPDAGYFTFQAVGQTNSALRLRGSGTSGAVVQAFTKASAPNTTEIEAGYAAIYKNTGTGTVTLNYNDGGTIKSVTLT